MVKGEQSISNGDTITAIMYVFFKSGKSVKHTVFLFVSPFGR